MRLQVNGRRVLEDLHTLRRFGAVNFKQARGGDGIPKGVSRVALSPEDIKARIWFASRCAEAGLSPRIDRLGNVLATSEGSQKRLLCGSHSDSQPEGGWLDGALGCILALEASRALRDLGAHIDVINFSDEEGRFGTLTGSQAFCGSHVDWSAVSLSPESVAPKLTLAEAASRAQAELGASGFFFDDLLQLPMDKYLAFFEAHIEQGQRLEKASATCAAVSSIVGLRQYRITANGVQNHAGTTTMVDRKDAARVLLRLCTIIDEAMAQVATTAAPHLVWTFGVIELKPGTPSAIPGYAACILQIRDPDDHVLTAAEASIHHIVRSEARLPVDIVYDAPSQLPVHLDPHLLGLLQPFCDLTVHSGALHDAASIATVGNLPAAMLFVPSIGGVSHDFTEDTHEAHITKGAVVYTQAAARMLGFSDVQVDLV